MFVGHLLAQTPVKSTQPPPPWAAQTQTAPRRAKTHGLGRIPVQNACEASSRICELNLITMAIRDSTKRSC